MKSRFWVVIALLVGSCGSPNGPNGPDGPIESTVDCTNPAFEGLECAPSVLGDWGDCSAEDQGGQCGAYGERRRSRQAWRCIDEGCFASSDEESEPCGSAVGLERQDCALPPCIYGECRQGTCFDVGSACRGDEECCYAGPFSWACISPGQVCPPGTRRDAGTGAGTDAGFDAGTGAGSDAGSDLDAMSVDAGASDGHAG